MVELKSMQCPNCQSRLNKVFAKCRYGVNIELDQCFGCGGIWCDDLEMYRIDPKLAKDIDEINIEKLTELKPIKKELICPRCRSALEDFKDPYFPENIKLEQCFKCGGIWLNRGRLTQFKNWQKERIKKSKKEKLEENKEFADEINKLLILNRDRKIDTLGKIGKFLKQPARRESIYFFNPKTGLLGVIFFILQIIFQAAVRYKSKDNKWENDIIDQQRR